MGAGGSAGADRPSIGQDNRVHAKSALHVRADEPNLLVGVELLLTAWPGSDAEREAVKRCMNGLDAAAAPAASANAMVVKAGDTLSWFAARKPGSKDHRKAIKKLDQAWLRTASDRGDGRGGVAAGAA
jgi:LysM repeat protein